MDPVCGTERHRARMWTLYYIPISKSTSNFKEQPKKSFLIFIILQLTDNDDDFEVFDFFLFLNCFHHKNYFLMPDKVDGTRVVFKSQSEQHEYFAVLDLKLSLKNLRRAVLTELISWPVSFSLNFKFKGPVSYYPRGKCKVMKFSRSG
ncbi:hypothetical protein BpHYR1_013210 [Brachionus plicatilis]|uniref:Uncharacterized protein n=1 Tax=Brachionus plicatilis TaxID=10195 RepID=A0A3M7QLG5_BRAPC|nr:hypothetical protein BpHYR1_013210 [Brachionus plicatilis]